MFEDKTQFTIHQEMLNEISNDYDKTTGSFIFDTTKPAALQFEKNYQSLNNVIDKMNVENLAGEELELYINQRTGIVRREATSSAGELEVKGNGYVNKDDLFETETGVQFVANETKQIISVGLVKIRAVIAGETGNVPANQITLIPISLFGINSVTNLNPTIDGFDEESDEELLERYYERVRTPATSGNKMHYLNWAKEVPGVGEAKVFPLFNGNNTVKVTIIDADMKPASTLLVEQVQNYIDPNSEGLGNGTAPIGAYCTVVSATGLTIDISFSAVLDTYYLPETVIETVKTNIKKYLQDIAFQDDYVSYAQIGGLILQSDGVLDYSGLTVSGGTTNITIGADQVAILGGVTIV